MVGLIVVAIISLTRHDVTLARLAVVIIVLGLVVLVFAWLIGRLDARAVAAPIIAVRDAMRHVEGDGFDVEVKVYDATGLGQLQAGFDQMVRGLREREHLRGMFGRHVGREVAAAATTGDVELDDHAGEALAAARSMAIRLAEEVPDPSAGVGVSTGEAVAGNVGERSRFEFTVIGDAMNAAGPLTELALDSARHRHPARPEHLDRHCGSVRLSDPSPAPRRGLTSKPPERSDRCRH